VGQPAFGRSSWSVLLNVNLAPALCRDPSSCTTLVGVAKPCSALSLAAWLRDGSITTPEPNKSLTFYNFVRQHKTLRCSPAMAAGLSPTLWSMTDIVALIDAEAAPIPKCGSYKPRAKLAEANSN